VCHLDPVVEEGDYREKREKGVEKEKKKKRDWSFCFTH
jgi:hypothetical protein